VVDGPAEDGAAEWRSPMVDVSGLSLAELAARSDDEALRAALRRLADDLAEPGGPIAGFNSAL
jgi:FXSXX-COOH protein